MSNLINSELTACMLGITKKTVTRWQSLKSDPLPVAAKGGRGRADEFDIAAVHEWGIRRHTKKSGADYDGEIYDYQHERARLTHAQADKAELENQELRGEVIPAAVVQEVWTESVINVRARILAMPTRIAHAAAAVETVPEAHEIVRAACYEALEEIATDELSAEQLARIDSATAAWEEKQANLI
jgi:phage terminase Nu1 subunit (DNA packaging protein)